MLGSEVVQSPAMARFSMWLCKVVAEEEGWRKRVQMRKEKGGETSFGSNVKVTEVDQGMEKTSETSMLEYLGNEKA